MNTPPTAVVLFAHGSRDPLWRAPIDAVATEMARQSPQTAVRCAFLELTEPTLDACIEALVHEGHRSLRIVPMFLGVGRHAREDLPQLVADLRARFPQLALQLCPSIGEYPALTRAMAQIALQTDAA